MKRTEPPLVPEEALQAQRDAMREISAWPNRPQTYWIVTYGCQMNAHDSETLSGMLSEMGLRQAASRDGADLILFNTCCIRDNAERKALGNMTWLRQLKARRPELVLCVCGCMVQQPKMSQVLLRQYPFFDVAFGTHNLYRFPSLLLRALQTRRQVIEAGESDGCIAEGLPVRRESPFRAYVTIMYGCDNFCSYCIVPYVRGRERSRHPDAILREAEALVDDGVQEIMLLGQNVNSYGNDLSGAPSFARLLRSLDSLGVPRIRFMPSHPKDISDELIDAMASSAHVAAHLHLPVQSGSDAVLRAMNRGYTRETYLRRAAALRAAMPDIALTTDLIVGFPGETEEDFADTLSLVEQMRYDSAYTFIFSPREGTRASRMSGQVPAPVATERIERLIAAQERISAQIYAGLVGTRQCVLAEERSRRREGQIAGKCSRGLTCNFDGDAAMIGRFVPVRITEAGHNTLRAVPLAKEEA